MARRRAAPAEDEMPTAPFWMATFADMVTLLMTFFIMIVAMSEVKIEKFREALSYFQGGTGMIEAGPSPIMGVPSASSTRIAVEQAERQEELTRRLREAGLEGAVATSITERGLHLVIADSVMFRPGEADLIGDAPTVLRIIAETLADDVAGVVVEGHTDDRPIQTARYPSNWELSAARAATVVRFLLTQPRALDAAHYQASGYGEFRPRATNASAGGRARNRRVEILLTTTPWPDLPLPTDSLRLMTPATP